MTDHADVIREHIQPPGQHSWREALAALDALVAERDAASTMLAEAERVVPGIITTAGRLAIGLNDRERAEAAEARAKELEAALEEARATLRWYWQCNGYPAWFGESERARLRSALGGGS